jgi:hypothetical protein
MTIGRKVTTPLGGDVRVVEVLISEDDAVMLDLYTSFQLEVNGPSAEDAKFLDDAGLDASASVGGWMVSDGLEDVGRRIMEVMEA